MTYEEWEQGLPEAVKVDPVWQFFAYRKALFLFDLTWEDCAKLMGDPRGKAVATQMIDSAGSISANIEEGHVRGPGKDRNHFLRISVGSSRETKGWYLRSRHVLPPEAIKHRMALLDDIISLLLTELKRQRAVR